MLCSHFTQNCILYFSEAKSPYFVTKNCWKSSYICVFILSKKRRNWFHKNLHNSGMVGRRTLPDHLLKRIFNALSIGVQYTLSFQWTNFGLKCLIYLNRTVLKDIYFQILTLQPNYELKLTCNYPKFVHVRISINMVCGVSRTLSNIWDGAFCENR